MRYSLCLTLGVSGNFIGNDWDVTIYFPLVKEALQKLLRSLECALHFKIQLNSLLALAARSPSASGENNTCLMQVQLPPCSLQRLTAAWRNADKTNSHRDRAQSQSLLKLTHSAFKEDRNCVFIPYCLSSPSRVESPKTVALIIIIVLFHSSANLYHCCTWHLPGTCSLIIKHGPLFCC